MIGKLIASLLKANTSLTTLVPEVNMYPYIINENTTLPALIYTVDNMDAEYDKDGWVQDACTFSVVSFSDNYASLQDISRQVRLALELKNGTTNNINIRNIYLTSQQEGYNINENVYLNKLTFDVEITSYS